MVDVWQGFKGTRLDVLVRMFQLFDVVWVCPAEEVPFIWSRFLHSSLPSRQLTAVCF